MKEIKFRGKRKDNGMWVYGYYFEAPLTHETGECASYLCGGRRFLISQNGVTFDVLPETVGQYSTVKDEDGMEIYEGDVVERPDCWPIRTGIVVFKDGKFVGNFLEEYKHKWEAETICLPFRTRVIGNIHEKVEKEKP